MKVKISDIVISERQRKGDTVDGSQTLEHITDLAKSIDKYGLLQPLLLNEADDGTLQLVAGFNRLQAAMFLGHTHIECTSQSLLSNVDRKEIELEENIRRKDLEWWEKAAAIAEIHDMRTALDPNWSRDKTAELTGTSIFTVTNSINMAEEMKEDPSMKQEATLRGALRNRQVKKQIEKRKVAIAKKKSGEGKTLLAVIRVGDALDLIRKEPDESFDAVVTNFPFGVDLKIGKNKKEIYHDEEQYITRLVQEICHESFRVLAPDSWMVAWFDIRKITYNNAQKAYFKGLPDKARTPELFDSMGLTFWLEEAGFSYVTPLPSIWAKPNKTTGLIGDTYKGLVVAYEAFVFAAKGDAVMQKRGQNNLFTYDTMAASERVHALSMPTELCAEIISMVCLGGGRVLDPFAGSGSIGLGALERQCSFVGFELDPEKASNGNLRLQEHIFGENPDVG